MILITSSGSELHDTSLQKSFSHRSRKIVLFNKKRSFSQERSTWNYASRPGLGKHQHCLSTEGKGTHSGTLGMGNKLVHGKLTETDGRAKNRRGSAFNVRLDDFGNINAH